MDEIHLQRLRDAVASRSVKQVDAAVEALWGARDPTFIAAALELLEDDEGDPWPWSLVHAAESFDHATYIAQLLAALPVVRARAPDWALVLLMRTLNSDSARTEFVAQVRTAPKASKRAVFDLAKSLQLDEQFKGKVPNVLLAAAGCQVCNLGPRYDLRADALDRIARSADGWDSLKQCSKCGALWLDTQQYESWLSPSEAAEQFGGPFPRAW